MREILFRGFSPVIQEWVHGYYVKTKVGGREICTIIPLDDLHKTLSEKRWFEVIPSTVGQYTGLTDKNGKKAFEHDIIKHHFGDEVGVIKFGEYRNPFGGDGFGGHVGFYVDWVSGEVPQTLRKDLAYWMKMTEVIGNIHDNPELLEVDSRGKN